MRAIAELSPHFLDSHLMSFSVFVPSRMSGDIHVPRSSGFPDRLLNNLHTLLTDNQFTDVHINVQGSQTILCHKVVLAASSNVLRTMLGSGMKETANNEISLETYPAAVIQSIVRYFYNGDFSINKELILETIHASDYLELPELKNQLAKQAPRHIQPGQVLSWRKLGELLNLHEIIVKCKSIFEHNFQQVATTGEFLQLELAELVDVIKDCENVSADLIIEGVLGWAQHDPSNRSARVEDLLDHITLEQCSVEVLTEAIEKFDEVLSKCPYSTIEKIHKAMASIALETNQSPQGSTPQGSTTRPKTKSEDTSKVQSSKDSAGASKADPQATSPKQSNKLALAIIGGYNSKTKTANGDCWVLDNADTFQPLTQLPASACANYSSACSTPEGFAVTGGNNSDKHTWYLAATKSWSTRPAMLKQRHLHASFYHGGRIYVIGGYVSGSGSASVDYYDVRAGTWHSAPDMPQNIECPHAAIIQSGVYVLSTQSNPHLLFHLDLSSMKWQTRSSPHVYSHYVSLTSAGDRLYMAGGGSSVLCCYYPASDSWSQLTGPTLRHTLGSLIHHEGKLYLCGGSWSDNDRTEIEEYDVARDQWTVCKYETPQPLQYLTAIKWNILQ